MENQAATEEKKASLMVAQASTENDRASLMQAQAVTEGHRSDLMDAQADTESCRKVLFCAQAASETAKVNAGIFTSQASLYSAQADGFGATARYNKAKILGDMYAISRTAGDSGVGSASSSDAKTAANAIV